MVLNVDNFRIRLIFSDAQFKGGEQNVVRDGPSLIGQRVCSVSKKTGTSHCTTHCTTQCTSSWMEVCMEGDDVKGFIYVWDKRFLILNSG